MTDKAKDATAHKTELGAVKDRLAKGSLTKEDLQTLKTLIERAEEATKQLRAAIVE